MRQIIVMIILTACLLLFSGMSLLTGKYYMSSFEGKVIDTETKAPIEGAAVLAVYYAEAFSPIGGSKLFVVDAQETLSGPDCQFKIPSKSGRAENYRGKLEGSLLIFTPGYGVFPDHKLSKAAIEFKGWPPPEKYVVYEIPMLKTKEERLSNIPSRPEIPYEKMKLFVNSINNEHINLGLHPLIIPKEESK